MTITGGTWSSTSGETGGGVVVGSGVLNLKYCSISNNEGNDGAGGGAINSYATTNILGCSIHDNTAVLARARAGLFMSAAAGS